MAQKRGELYGLPFSLLKLMSKSGSIKFNNVEARIIIIPIIIINIGTCD